MCGICICVCICAYGCLGMRGVFSSIAVYLVSLFCLSKNLNSRETIVDLQMESGRHVVEVLWFLL